jgi:hypothetical protein
MPTFVDRGVSRGQRGSPMVINLSFLNKNTQTLIDASKEVRLEVNVWKTKYMFVSHYQNADQNWDINIANSIESVSQFKYLGMTVTNQNCFMRK